MSNFHVEVMFWALVVCLVAGLLALVILDETWAEACVEGGGQYQFWEEQFPDNPDARTRHERCVVP